MLRCSFAGGWELPSQLTCSLGHGYPPEPASTAVLSSSRILPCLLHQTPPGSAKPCSAKPAVTQPRHRCASLLRRSNPSLRYLDPKALEQTANVQAIISFTHYQKLTQWHLITAPEAQASLINQRNKVRDDALNRGGEERGGIKSLQFPTVCPL